MPKYNCTVLFDASSNIEVEANSPQEAAELAEDLTAGNQSLCHQCSDTLDTGDCIGVVVYDEGCDELLIDTRYNDNPRMTLEQSEDLIEDLADWSKYVEVDFAHQSLKKHGIEVLIKHGLVDA
jgi:hypothetical protein